MNTNLITAREEKGYTQAEVATLTNLSQTSISLYEQGLRDPRKKNKEKLASLYEKSIFWLFFDFDYNQK